MGEVWKDISGFEGVYIISNHGRICSLNRVEKDRNGVLRFRQGKMLIPQPNSQGYLRVELKHNGKRERWFVHRLVALHFIENPQPERYTVVNHIDGNHLNNKSENLEWTNQYGNIHHAIKSGRLKRTKEWLQHLREINEKNGKSVVGTNIATGEIVTFTCLNDCKKEGFQPSCVSNCCHGLRKSHKGFVWRWK